MWSICALKLGTTKGTRGHKCCLMRVQGTWIVSGYAKYWLDFFLATRLVVLWSRDQIIVKDYNRNCVCLCSRQFPLMSDPIRRKWTALLWKPILIYSHQYWKPFFIVFPFDCCLYSPKKDNKRLITAIQRSTCCINFYPGLICLRDQKLYIHNCD